MTEYETVWTGASWREAPQPIKADPTAKVKQTIVSYVRMGPKEPKIHHSTTLRQRRHAAGRCVDCNVPSETYRCLECRADLLERERARRERKKKQAA